MTGLSPKVRSRNDILLLSVVYSLSYVVEIDKPSAYSRHPDII